MKIKKILSAAALITSISYSTYALAAINLQDTMVSAYNFNNQLKAQQGQLLATQEDVPQAYSEFMPQAAFDGELRRGDSYNLITQPSGGSGRLTHNDHIREFVLTQPLFNGGQSIARIHRAYDAVAAANSDLATIEEQVLINAISAHMDVVFNKQVLELSKNNEKVLKEQLDSTKETFKLGETTRTDVSQAEARYSRAVSDRIKSEGDLIASLANYKNITGQATDHLIENASNFMMPQVSLVIPDSLDGAINKAFETNPALVSQKYQEKIAEHDINIAKGQLLPTLSLRGTLSRETDSYSRGDIHDNESLVMMDLSVPIYQSGSEYSRIRQAKHLKESQKYQTDQRKDQIRANVTKAWEDILTSRATIKSTDSAVKSATHALEGVRQEQEVGSRTILDVLDAEQELYIARVNLANAQRNEVVALFNLKYHLGELTAKELNLPVTHFDSEGHMNNTKFKMIGF